MDKFDERLLKILNDDTRDLIIKMIKDFLLQLQS